jgi:hypothetical protein
MATKPKAGKIYVCYESFGTSDPLGGCTRGTRLSGDSPKVQRWPQFFLEDGADESAIHAARAKLYEEAGAPPLLN